MIYSISFFKIVDRQFDKFTNYILMRKWTYKNKEIFNAIQFNQLFISSDNYQAVEIIQQLHFKIVSTPGWGPFVQQKVKVNGFIGWWMERLIVLMVFALLSLDEHPEGKKEEM